MKLARVNEQLGRVRSVAGCRTGHQNGAYRLTEHSALAATLDAPCSGLTAAENQSFRKLRGNKHGDFTEGRADANSGAGGSPVVFYSSLEAPLEDRLYICL